jgi:Tol biopolymer transport system component
MKALAIALAMSAMLTIEQRDDRGLILDDPSSAVSADGRYVAFATYAQLAGADTDDTSDIYVLDRLEQQVTLESTGITDPGTVECTHPVISADGRFLVYEMGDGVVWRDRRERTSRIFATGRQPVLTQDGRTVLFASDHDIYSIDLSNGNPRRVSIDLPGLDASAASVSPGVSADGRFVTFSARPPVIAGRIGVSHVFVRDTQLNTTRHLGAGWTPSISGDGRYVAFVSAVRNMPHIHLADLHGGTAKVISKSVGGGLANGASANPSLSADGRFVVYQSEASDLVHAEDFNLLWDIFLFDRTTGTTVRVSGDPGGAWMEPSVGPSIDASGSVIAFSSRHPTGPEDTENDFDLFVAAIQGSRDAHLITEVQKIKR